MSSFRSRLLPLAAACAVVTAAGQARADREGIELILLAVGTPMAQSTLLPGYISTVMYGLNHDERMPIPWAAMNSITGAMGASFGIGIQFK